MTATIIAMLTILGLAFVQNISFSIVSRSRNRDNVRYHLIAAFFSNTIWFMTFRQLVRHDMTLLFFLPYVVGTMIGSVFGIKISMFIEKLLGAAADGHLQNPKPKEMSDELRYARYMDSARFEIAKKFLSFNEWIKAGRPN